MGGPMGAGLHGSARTTPRVRAELQAAKEGTLALAVRYGLNAKTVAKWWALTADGRCGGCGTRCSGVFEGRPDDGPTPPAACGAGARGRSMSFAGRGSPGAASPWRRSSTGMPMETVIWAMAETG